MEERRDLVSRENWTVEGSPEEVPPLATGVLLCCSCKETRLPPEGEPTALP